MLLTIDAGNTNVCFGFYKGEELLGVFRVTTKLDRTSDEFAVVLDGMLERFNLEPSEIKQVIIGSVVPKTMHALVNSIKKVFQVEPLLIGPGVKTGISIHCDNPKEVGADIIVNVAAAYKKYKTHCIVVDFGTATTYDYISDKGVFKGVVIAPGLGISAQALTGQTAQLPEIEIKKPNHVLGTNTVDAMQSGIVNGYVGQVRYLLQAIKKELNLTECKVIATGGLGRVIYDNAQDCFDEYDPLIKYAGLKMIWELNQ